MSMPCPERPESNPESFDHLLIVVKNQQHLYIIALLQDFEIRKPKGVMKVSRARVFLEALIRSSDRSVLAQTAQMAALSHAHGQARSSSRCGVSAGAVTET